METYTSKLLFLAWLEVPYFIGAHYETSYPAVYKPSVEVEIYIRFRNDLLRVSTSNRWTNAEYRKRQIRASVENPDDEVFYVPRYVTEAELVNVRDLVQRYNLPYLHVEGLETVVEMRAELDASSLVDEVDTGIAFSLANFLPQTSFFNKQVLPKIASAVNAYRVATLPAIRYSIHPVSENLIGTAFIQIQDETGKIIQQANLGFDVRSHNRSMQYHVENLDVQSRFEAALADPDKFEAESMFCSSYYLFHMRRWAEAVTIASGVVDTLVRQSVFSRTSEPLARLLWSKYRTQTDSIFNQLLPALGYSKLADVEQTLWIAFKKAKDYRGSAAHGSEAFPFDWNEERKVCDHLKALYSVARWLSIQSGRPWALDVQKNGELLPVF